MTVSALRVRCSELGGTRLLKGKECHRAVKLGTPRQHCKLISIISSHAFWVRKREAHPAILQSPQHLRIPQWFASDSCTLSC